MRNRLRQALAPIEAACAPRSRTGDNEIDRLFDLANAHAEIRTTTPITADGVLEAVFGPAHADRAVVAESPRWAGKKVFDLCVALTVLTVTAPVLVAVAIAVKITSPGSLFYLSERIGRGGKPFRMIKFRTMYTDADRHVARLIERNGGNPVFFKMKGDPRVTPVGRILRKYGIDELPQFFNVLRGDMSVVGPRPQVRREIDTDEGIFRRGLLVKPGITGLWQVTGRAQLAPEDAVRLDRSYLDNWSIMLDLQIVTKTFSTVLDPNSAY